MCLSMGNVERGAWVSPRVSRDVGHWHVFSEATCSLEGLRAPRRAETRGRAPGEGSRCMGGRGIRVPFDGQRRAGGMGEPPG